MSADAAPEMLVRSLDGTELAVFVRGAGPPLVLVHGSLQDHSISEQFVDELASRFTCFSMDRRGFGASGDGSDGSEYRIEIEFDDVAAVVDHVAATAGERVDLWGHSYGASCAMGGAARTDNVAHLILYEPSLGLRYPPGVIDEIEASLATGDDERAIVLVLTQILELSEADVDAMRATPVWQRRVAVAHTVPRECRAEEAWVYRPGQFEGIAAPTLLLAGSDSPPDLKRATDAAIAAIHGAERRVLDGHAHVAHRADPAMVAEIVTEFAARP